MRRAITGIHDGLPVRVTQEDSDLWTGLKIPSQKPAACASSYQNSTVSILLYQNTQEHHRDYPILAMVARDYFAIQRLSNQF